MKFDLENKKHVNFVKLADDVLLQNCILEPIPQDEQPFGDNRFVKVTEGDMRSYCVDHTLERRNK